MDTVIDELIQSSYTSSDDEIMLLLNSSQNT